MNIGIPLPTRHGWGLLLPVLPLCLAGVITVNAATGGGDDTRLLSPDGVKQVIFIGTGVVALFAALFVGYQRIAGFSYVLFGLCLVMLLCLILDRWVNIPFVPYGSITRWTRRWIQMPGFRIQPSELMKVVYVLALAWYLRYRQNYRTLGGLIPPFALTLLPMAMILLQPDLGTVLLFLPVLFAMLFAAGARGKHLAIVVALGLLCAPLFWLKIRDYQRLRITGVLMQSEWLRDYLEQPPTHLTGAETRWDWLRSDRTEPDDWWKELVNWETETGHQLVRSKMAIGSGGIVGHGTGQGIFVDYNFLPEKHNDMIFAVIAHQWGLIGALFVVLCYVTIVAIGYDVATLTHDPFGRLVAVCLSTMIAVQTLTNLCMTVGLGPITGVTLPFVSAGGSSLIASFLAIGLLISVARHRPMLIANRPFEFAEETQA